MRCGTSRGTPPWCRELRGPQSLWLMPGAPSHVCHGAAGHSAFHVCMMCCPLMMCLCGAVHCIPLPSWADSVSEKMLCGVWRGVVTLATRASVERILEISSARARVLKKFTQILFKPFVPKLRVYICSSFPPQCLCYSMLIPFLRFFSYNPLPLAPQHLLGCPCFGGAAKCLDRSSASSVASRNANAPLGQLPSPASGRTRAVWLQKNDMKKVEEL